MGDDETIAGVATGAVEAALTLMELLNTDDPGLDAEALRARVGEWDQVQLTQAFGLLIGVAMNLAEPPPEEPDAIHLVVPAVVGRLQSIGPTGYRVEDLPMISAVLTAAALGMEPYEWRIQLGPIPATEALAWCYTAWALFDLLDFPSGERGGMARLVRELLAGQ